MKTNTTGKAKEAMSKAQAAKLRRALVAARDGILDTMALGPVGALEHRYAMTAAERCSMDGLRLSLDAWVIALRPKSI